jgi:hypothetical protein
MIHKFAEQHGRSLKFEIEPGTFLLANAGVLLSTIQVLSPLSSSMTLSPPQDIVSTGSGGYNFLKIDAGMTEVTATLPLPRRKSLIPCPHGRSFVRRSMAPLIPFKSSPTLPFIDSKPVTQPSTMSWCDPLSSSTPRCCDLPFRLAIAANLETSFLASLVSQRPSGQDLSCNHRSVTSSPLAGLGPTAPA